MKFAITATLLAFAATRPTGAASSGGTSAASSGGTSAVMEPSVETGDVTVREVLDAVHYGIVEDLTEDVDQFDRDSEQFGAWVAEWWHTRTFVPHPERECAYYFSAGFEGNYNAIAWVDLGQTSTECALYYDANGEVDMSPYEEFWGFLILQ